MTLSWLLGVGASRFCFYAPTSQDSFYFSEHPAVSSPSRVFRWPKSQEQRYLAASVMVAHSLASWPLSCGSCSRLKHQSVI